MRTLIVFCHPCADSFNAALFAAARDALTRAGHEVRCVDLYAEQFNPILSAQEKQDYLPNTQTIVKSVAEHVENTRWAEGLVFIFPTWFYGPPAMLKGWLERVWLPGVAFKVPDKPGGKAGPGMQHITRLTVITTSGSPWWWLRLIRDPCRNLFTRGLRALLHPRCKTTYLQLHGMNTNTQAQREAFIAKVSRSLARFPA
jgi:NAD(P)H dehydrogenase (quinone)